MVAAANGLAVCDLAMQPVDERGLTIETGSDTPVLFDTMPFINFMPDSCLRVVDPTVCT